MDLSELLATNYGVITSRMLATAGYRRDEVSRAATRGDLVRLRQGWYASRNAAPEVVTAVKRGGSLSCVDALGLHGIWIPPTDRLHIRRTGHGERTRRHSGDSCAPPGARQPVRRSVDPLPIALQAAALCLEPDMLVAVVDSVLHRRAAGQSDINSWFLQHPQPVRQALTRCDADAESGTESLARYRLAARSLHARTQVRIRGVGRVDLLLGKRLVIEIDSRAHHTDRVAYQNDRRRDRRLMALGYSVVRLTYEQVLYEWSEVEPDLLDIARQRIHHRVPRYKTQRRPV